MHPRKRPKFRAGPKVETNREDHMPRNEFESIPTFELEGTQQQLDDRLTILEQ